MAFSFPTSPTLNQQYTFGSKTWRYNGTGWILVTGVDAAQSAWSTANLAYINSNTATTLAQGAFDNSNTKFSSSGGTIGGSVTVTSNLTVLGNVTFVGNVTSLQVTGNSGQFFGYASNGFTALYAGIPIGYDFQPQTVFQTSANENGYAQINIQNINNGGDASGDYVATADNGTENDTYVDFGIGSSTHSDPEFTLVGPNDGYLYVHGNTSTGGGDLVLGTFLDNDVVFAAGGMNDDNEQMRIIGSSNTITVRANLDTSNAKSFLLGPVANIHITGGSDDDFIRTDGSGTLIFASLTSANVIKVLYNTSNSSFIHANAAFDFANTLAGGLDTVNVSITLANDHANAAFDHANAAYQSQNATGQYANSAFVHANAAYDAANNALDTWVRGQANAAFIQANSSFFHANAAFEAANNALDTWVRGQANAAFTQANSGFIHANSAFAYANTLAGGAAIDNVARDSANSAGIYANGAFVAANVADEKAVASGNYANAAFIQANTPSYVANSAAAYANAAFIRANNSLDANNGGTVTGDVRVTGNLTVTGITTYVNTSTVLIADNILTLNAAIDQASAPTVNAGLEVDRGSSANVYMLWNETEDRWTFTNDGVSYEGVGYASTASYANSAFTVANGAFIVANAGILQANAAFFHANSAYESQNATGQYANAAFITSNSAFDHANAAYQSQNATGQYANSAFVQANASYDQANAAFIIANVAILQANAAFEVANVAILQANSAFFHANAGFITANASFNHANVAYDTANSADVYANSAYRHANGAFFHANAGFITANSAFIAANGALINAASAGAYANSAFLAANVADGKAVASGNYANAAFIRANNSLDANTGGSITGTIGITGNVIGSYVVANSGFTSTAGSSKLELTDIGLVVIDVASQQFKFGAAGIEASPGIYGGSFGGNKLSLNNETNLISDRFDIVKISTGENGTVKNEFTFANNAFTAPGRITAISFVANGPGGLNIAPTLASSYDHANAAFAYANNATGAVVTFAAQPPASGNSNGHIWIDSSDGTEYMYFKDTDGYQWVEFGPSGSNVSTNTYITADISAPYAQANAAFNRANASYNHANAAFIQANTSITSDRLSSNLKLNIIQILESANLYTTAIGGNVNIDIGNNTSYFFSSNTTANVTFNIRGNTTTTFDTTVAIGQTASVAIALKQGATKYKANVYIDGVLQTPYWLGNSAPNYATTQPQSIDVYTYTIFKTAANAYSILAANSNFGLAQGQPGQG